MAQRLVSMSSSGRTHDDTRLLYSCVIRVHSYVVQYNIHEWMDFTHHIRCRTKRFLTEWYIMVPKVLPILPPVDSQSELDKSVLMLVMREGRRDNKEVFPLC